MHNGTTESLTITIPQTAKLLGISRNLAYDLAKQGRIPVIHLGQKRLVVPRAALERMLSEVGYSQQE